VGFEFGGMVSLVKRGVVVGSHSKLLLVRCSLAERVAYFVPKMRVCRSHKIPRKIFSCSKHYSKSHSSHP
jgi:hypothetical protein